LQKDRGINGKRAQKGIYQIGKQKKKGVNGSRCRIKKEEKGNKNKKTQYNAKK
jgi:hypothetical protein